MPHIRGPENLVEVDESHLYAASHKLPLHEPFPVRKVIHGEREAFEIDWSPTGWTNWSWQQMVSHLTDEFLDWVVDGPDGRSGGILGCSINARPGSSDIKMQNQVKHRRQLPVFDFVIWRADGSHLHMHPGWNSLQIGCHEGAAPPAQVPAKGVGKSDGPGTFRRVVTEQYPKKLRFRKNLQH